MDVASRRHVIGPYKTSNRRCSVQQCRQPNSRLQRLPALPIPGPQAHPLAIDIDRIDPLRLLRTSPLEQRDKNASAPPARSCAAREYGREAD